jgi:hypothetical protein
VQQPAYFPGARQQVVGNIAAESLHTPGELELRLKLRVASQRDPDVSRQYAALAPAPAFSDVRQ